MSDMRIAFKVSRAWVLKAYPHLVSVLCILLGIKLYDISLGKYALLGKRETYFCIYITLIRLGLYVVSQSRLEGLGVVTYRPPQRLKYNLGK